jgi:outer membrane protein TolC
MTRTPLALFLAAALAAPGASAANLTLEQCIAIALNESPDAASASYEVEAASFRKKEAFGGYGPRLHIDAGFQRWDSTYALPLFGSLKQYCTSCPWNPSVPQQTAPDGSVIPEIETEALVLRPQWTWSAAATVAQPIGALWTVREANLLAQLGIDVAEIRRRTARRDISYQVVEAYYRVLEAKRLAEVAQKSVEQVTAQVSQARIFYESGTVARNDVLRAELGLAAAEQRLIQAKGGVTLARGRLATVMGREPTADIDVVDLRGEPTVPAPLPAGQAEQLAVERRLELREIAAHIEQAETGANLAKSKMLPQVNAVANYTRQTSSLFGLPKTWFVGATASWDIWEGGSTYYGIDEAKAQLAQARETRRKTEDLIRLDLQGAQVGVTTAAEALQVARHAVEQAEENFRIEQKRYQSASNTSFDVLDAETQLTTARGQHQAAIYDLVIAHSNLARAMGEEHPTLKATP